MKISRKLKNHIEEVIGNRVDNLRQAIEQRFRDGKLDNENWGLIDRAIISTHTCISSDINHIIEHYQGKR